MDEPSTTAVRNRQLPDDLAAAFRRVFGLDEPPATLGDWADETAGLFEDAGVSFGPEDVCSAEGTRHEAHVDGEVRAFACVLDALLFPFLVGGDRPVRVRSRSPVDGAVVEATRTAEGWSVDPAGAVMSFGVAADAAPPDDLDGALSGRNASFCPYVNAFPDEAVYEEWAAATPDAVTMALPLREGVSLARLLAARPPFEGGARE